MALAESSGTILAIADARGRRMIGRKAGKDVEEESVKLKGFDDFELRLGDTMRGERATMGKSLLDVQRELRIKASYIAAIENCDPGAFDTPGFIAGYVRSYARYLNMDPDEAFETFCEESGFSVAHGMSEHASGIRRSSREERLSRGLGNDIFSNSATPFIPEGEAIFSGIEPRAVGSSLVLLGLIGLIGFGGYTVLQEVQRVQVAPVEQAPVVFADLDPLDAAAEIPIEAPGAELASSSQPARRAEALDRLYRPQALDVPVLVARDAPIATLDPREIGNFAQPAKPEADETAIARAILDEQTPSLEPLPPVPQVVEEPGPRLQMVAVRPAWVRVRAADGTVIFEGVMEPGAAWDVPATEEPPVLRAGESGAIYFAMGDDFYGPIGAPGAVTSGLPLTVAALKDRFDVADPNADQGLTRYAEAREQSLQTE